MTRRLSMVLALIAFSLVVCKGSGARSLMRIATPVSSRDIEAALDPAAPLQSARQAEGCAPLDVDNSRSIDLSGHIPPDPSTLQGRFGPHVIPPKERFPGISDFAEITPQLYRGGRPSKEGLDCLQRMGINIVVSTEGWVKSLRKETEKRGMQYIDFGWECSFPKDRIFADFLQLLRDNPGSKVFVYCHFGDDRTSMMIAAYRMAEQSWSADEAKKEMEVFGFNFFHRRICTGLSSYADNFPTHWSEGRAFEKLRNSPPSTAALKPSQQP